MASLRNLIGSAILAGSLALGGNAYAGERDQTQEDPGHEQEFRKSSLFEATVYTGTAAMSLTSIVFAYEINRKGMDGNDILNSYKNAFTKPPVWDPNPWYVNYVGHPIFGSESYLLARNRGHSFTESFLYSTAASVAWEYALEPAVGARPSIQDLMFTSTLGSVLGELRYEAKKRLEDNEDTFSKVLTVILDPIDAVWKAVE